MRLGHIFALAAVDRGRFRRQAEQPVWTGFHGDLGSRKFSAVESFTPETAEPHRPGVGVPDRRRLGRLGRLPQTVWSATPVYANGTLYLGTPFYRIVALDPATGAGALDLRQPVHARDADAARAQEPRRRLLGRRRGRPLRAARLHRHDGRGASRGRRRHRPSLRGLRRGRRAQRQPVEPDERGLPLLAPPAADGRGRHAAPRLGGDADWEYSVAPRQPPRHRRADGRASVGDRLHPRGDHRPDRHRQHLDGDDGRPDLGLVYVPVSSPSPNYWGGNRTEGIPLATSTTAVDIETGEVVWSFQHVRHDIWDYDTPSAPHLVDLERRRRDGAGARPDDQAGVHLRARPAHG
jgi:quinoprotein glucose dehydrogenase